LQKSSASHTSFSANLETLKALYIGESW